ncbi:hypothetical protein QVD17_19930 [Tagetes erecta]|uniref:Uncharacterized protein n=1 Tax=Tagetes erecta TaxID=13708 RepID=A0AAD8KKI5_TARER|nr:hypothetical protein QVD17_19930 [Tagetes erecta]
MSGSRGGTRGRTPYSGGRSGGRSGARAGSKLPHESSPSSNDVSTGQMFTSGGDKTRGGSRGGSRGGARGSTLFSGGRLGGMSGGQASHESSPGCSDATTRQKFTCAGRVLFRGGDVSHGGSTGRGCGGLGDVDGVPSHIGYNQRLNAINDPIDDGYNHEDIDSGDDNEGEDAGDDTDHPSQRDSNYEEGVRGTSHRKRVSRIGDKFASFEVHQSISRDYLQAMTKKYGANFTNDDPDVYLGLQEGGSSHRIYGIGSSDLNYLITGIPSSSYGIAPSYIEYRKSQERVEKLEARIEEMQQQVEETTRKQLEDFMKNWQSQANI